MRTLLLLCGRPFSGKSTLAQRLAADLGAAVVSLDAINLERGLVSGAGLPTEEWARTLEIAKRRTSELLETHAGVVIDDTLCFRWIRDDFRALALAADARPVLVYLDPPRAILDERMRLNDAAPQRTGIAPSVLEEHLAAFETPTEDERPIPLRSVEEIEAWLGTI